ncbi:uncharacterized protein N7482_005504 [Penicillium canariense]|uniref:Telomerase reverse transcriptase n=1 Tax=Penicillium canariense TaxID=189055 RepID=A0A9W9I4S7_9EURO|nr:uncharacterized protein N7482_005504 [Penicillium canariense]KAJ5166723.1 hypothetical protein N7482_005504 [Penicillium canariense]
MGKKRKRPGKNRGPTASSQTSSTASPGRFKAGDAPPRNNHNTTHPVISLYYRQVLTLRQYLLRQLPASSKLRRRRIASLRPPDRSSSIPERGHDHVQPLADLLDSTLVGELKEPSPKINCERERDYRAFTQSQSRSILVSTDTGPTSPQSEVVNFVIESLFARSAGYQKPQHLLTHGYAPHRPTNPSLLETSILGLVAQFPNRNVQTLKQSPWADILGLLGQNGDEIMMRLLFDCGIFAPVNARRGIYYQLSGLPLSELDQIDRSCLNGKGPLANQKSSKDKQDKRKGDESHVTIHSPNSIVFSRRSMLYSRSGSESKGELHSGLGATHVLNRYRSLDSEAQSIHVMNYIFPRQFGLLNAFASTANRTDSSHCFKSCVFREAEISRLIDEQQQRRPAPKGDQTYVDKGSACMKLPRRLRGQAIELVRRLRVRHAKCSYQNLLDYYCPTRLGEPWKLGAACSPVKKRTENREPESSIEEKLITQLQATTPSSTRSSNPKYNTAGPAGEYGKSDRENKRIQKGKINLTDYATPASAVSAFCRAVLLKLIPPPFFGDGVDGLANRKIIMKNVDSFIKMRRFESPSLHEVCNGLKVRFVATRRCDVMNADPVYLQVTGILWLVPAKVQIASESTKDHIGLSDFQKRTELLHELIYYVFDSMLIPLVRTNFYVTESQTHRNRLFYFRHDVWRNLTEQPMTDLKAGTFEQLQPRKAQVMLAKRSLGLGALRLLPKSAGLRPILNLKKRVLMKSQWGGNKSYLGASVNSNLAPIHNVLTYERERCPSRMGSALMSMGDMHPRLKVFKTQLSQRAPLLRGQNPGQQPPLFFVKLDIQACFDTIPQKRLLHLIEELVSENAYHITKYVAINPAVHGKAKRKFLGRAAPLTKQQHLLDLAADGIGGALNNTVYVDTIKQKEQDADELLCLLDEHVRNNLVKIGKNYFRQRNGIPQGSVLSSLLCNFFYAELERQVLSFLQPADSLLLRLVDDFLLITTDVDQAIQFLQVMLRGQPAYGVSVNPAKSMVNFSAAVDGIYIPRLEGTPLFPYCGTLIDTHTLEIHKDQDRMLEGGASAAATLSNTLTVETSRLPGRSFHRKMLALLRPQLHSMYLDSDHNSRNIVLANLYTGLITTAMRMYRYMKSLRGRAQPRHPIIIQTINDLVQQTASMIQARRASCSAPLKCFVQLSHLQYLASAAFRFVLGRKQTRYAPVLYWLDLLGRSSRPATNAEAGRLLQVVRKGNALFEAWRF